MRPRMYGSSERYCTSRRSCPRAGAGTAVSSRRKSVSAGFPFGRAARTICRPCVVMTSPVFRRRCGCVPFFPLRPSSLLCPELSERTEPVLEVIGASDLAIPDGLDVDRHDQKALGRMRRTEKLTRRSSGHLAAKDDAIARHQDFLDVELHVGDGLGETTDDFERPCRMIARRDFSAESVDERRLRVLRPQQERASRVQSGPLTLTFAISQLPGLRNRAMAGGSNGYQNALVRRQLTRGLVACYLSERSAPVSDSKTIW